LEAEYGPRLQGLTLGEKVRELARLATEHGHMAEVVEEPNGALSIKQCHCPIGDVAAEVGHPCRMEMGLYSRLLGVDLERSSFLPDHDSNCTYVVTNGNGTADANAASVPN
jgi:predicted ArsR family transcriptional regulator